MMGMIDRCFGFLRSQPFTRLEPLVLINGLAEQSVTWFRNRRAWEWYFDVKVPELLIYDGPVLHRRIDDGLPITVDFLADQLEAYLDTFVQKPPYHLVASSLGGQVAVEYAVRHPDNVHRVVLICPSGMGGEEKLPFVEGVRHNDYEAMISSIFYHRTSVNPGVVRYYERQFASKKWKKGILRTVRGTSSHSVRDKLPQMSQPTLVICGQEDQIVDPRLAREALQGLPNFRLQMIPRCGHAPHMEYARYVNRVVRDFLTNPQPALFPTRRPAKTIEPKPSYA
jgi:pimeloyl-ACP methyl ester carboxylesterase